MANVDMNTEAVANTFRDEAICQDIWEANNNEHFKYVPTNKNGTSVADGFIIDRATGYPIAFVEQKSRSMTLEQLHNEYENELLINSPKMANSITISRLLNLPWIMWTYLKGSDVVVSTRMTNEDGTSLVSYRQTMGQYQTSANGGHEWKGVTYFSVTGSRVFSKREPYYRLSSSFDTLKPNGDQS